MAHPDRRAFEPTRPSHATYDLTVELLNANNEFVLFGGKEFQEVRFGFSAIDAASPDLCGDILREFSARLAEYGAPVAYIHYPHYWAAADRTRCWLRVAFAVDRSTGVDLAIQVAAYEIAARYSVPLYAYDPLLTAQNFSGRFALLLNRPVGDSHTRHDEVASRSIISFCGIARAGTVADALRAMPPSPIYGCSVGVLYGRIVGSLLVDVKAVQGIPASVEVARVGMTGPDVVVAAGSQTVPKTFWIGWSCGEAVGVVVKLLEIVDVVMRDFGLPAPHPEYSVARVLTDGFTCAGKIKFTAADVTESILSALAERLSVELGHLQRGWAPSDATWRDRPVVVSAVEPREEPWASLVVPDVLNT